ncbi:DinB family protein [Emticicia sp. TH156]|uniref:DinB family protein n=2 Tax=unclassified Emticicia TaxID=2627301 RepID=UPI000C782A07|nr:DinB family protein [Emticicia sp. TH156]PLK46176.1 metal-dependent hydrolase [Emticicia sp. TH156]
MTLEERQFPIGKWKPEELYSEEEMAQNVSIIEQYPAKYTELTKNLSAEQLAQSYREGAWSIHKIVVHISDMHILHFARFKQTLCEDNTQGYGSNINGWANNPEVETVPLADALLLLEATHKRWVHLLKSMSPADFNKSFFHVGRQMNVTLAQALHMGAWHSKHHLEHIKIALQNPQ